MAQESLFAPRSAICLTHRRQKITHFCTDLTCQSQPLLCSLCLNDNRIRSQHPHDAAIRSIQEGTQLMASIIKNQSKTAEMVFERTIGAREFQGIKLLLQRGGQSLQQLQNRIQGLRVQLQLQIQLLMKQFQKQLQIQKQQLQRRLEEHKKIYASNLELVRQQCIDLMIFVNHTRFYSNPNVFTLKIISESQKKSNQWLLLHKKVIFKMSQILQNVSFSNNTIALLSKINRSIAYPSWRNDQRQLDIEMNLKGLVRQTFLSWMQIPQILQIDRIDNSSNKYLSYPVTNI